MNDAERKVLHSLVQAGEEWALPFDPICKEWGLERRIIRRACRSLKRKGLAEFERGLWTEDGEPAGSGYRVTPAGVSAFDSLTESV